MILLLARQRYTTPNSLQEAAELITRSACDIYQIDCASIWNLEGQRLVPISAYHRADQQHRLPDTIDASGFPDYLEALHSSRAIDATHALRDPRTREMAESLRAKDIHAMLDASIRVDGQVVGVLCLEQSGSSRAWQSDEIAFAGELADQFAQVINNHNRRTATSALHLFQRAVEQRQRLSAGQLRRRGGVRQPQLHRDHPVQRRRSPRPSPGPTTGPGKSQRIAVRRAVGPGQKQQLAG